MNSHHSIEQNSLHCTDCHYRSVCFPRSIPPTTCDSPLIGSQRKLHKFQILCTPKHKFESVYVVKKGVLKASILGVEGRERITGFYLPGDLLGLEGISKAFYPYSIESLTESVICELSYNQFLKVMTSASLQEKFFFIASQRINMGSYINFLRAEQRIAGFLLELAERLNCSNPLKCFHLPISRQAIGDYLGLACETVIRKLNLLQEQKIIRISNKQVEILDFPTLTWLSQGGLLEDIA